MPLNNKKVRVVKVAAYICYSQHLSKHNSYGFQRSFSCSFDLYA